MLFSYRSERRHAHRICAITFFAVFFALILTFSAGNVYAGDSNPSKGWKKIDGNTYYYNSQGTAMTGVHKIKGKFYLFRDDGTLVKKNGLIKQDGKEYYVSKKGPLKTGWVAYKEKGKMKASYFMKKNGAMKKGGKLRYLEIPKSGRLGEAYYYGVKVLNRNDWKMRKTFVYIARHTRYAHRSMRRDTINSYAIYGFTNHKGNCYVMASQFYITMKLLGKNVKQYEGTVGSRERAPHSWCTIKDKKGKTLIYDISFYNHFHHLRGFPSGYAMKEGTHNSYKYNKKDKKIIGR